jgi:hypothetical protein
MLENIATRTQSNTLLSDIDPLAVFPQTTDEDLEKLESRIDGWYALVGTLLELKQQDRFKLEPFNRYGVLYIRIEQYLLLLTRPHTQIEKEKYWADVETARNAQDKIPPIVTVTAHQIEFDLFKLAITDGFDVLYELIENWEICLKRGQQFYNTRKWQCSGWRVILLGHEPLVADKPSDMTSKILAIIDEQKDEQFNS